MVAWSAVALVRETVSLCRVWQGQTSRLSERLPYHHKSASETSGRQSASKGSKFVSAQRPRCDRGGKTRNIRDGRLLHWLAKYNLRAFSL
jgi:predicted RecB family endonuclease